MWRCVVCSSPYTWSLRRMSMPVGPCLYTWLIVPSGRLHTHAILRISSAAVSSSRYRAWYTAQKWKGVVQRTKPQSLIFFFFFLPCKPDEMLLSPFSLVPCLSTTGLSWQMYIVNLGRTDLHKQIQNIKVPSASHTHTHKKVQAHTHLDLSALNSLIPSAGPQIWTRSSRVNFNKSEPDKSKSQCCFHHSIHTWVHHQRVYLRN